ncbi:MAG TPA: SseB family protein [Baekduia sp.]|nr:SseB family protein [Baekduia sp.]
MAEDEQIIDDPLRRALREVRAGGDKQGVGPALLESTVITLAGRDGDGEAKPTVIRRQETGLLEVVAFTDQQRANEWGPKAEGWLTLPGRELVLAVEGACDRLLIDPGAAHSGFLSREGLHELATLARTTTRAEIEAPQGAWANRRVAEAVRGAVAADDGIVGAWLVERERFPTVALHLAEGADEGRAIKAVAEALRPLAAGGARLAILLLNEEQRAQAEATGPPLQ